MALLLDDNNVVVGYGTFSEESSEYVMLKNIAPQLFNPDDYRKVEVDKETYPADIDKYEEYYCYTEEDGFYKNPNWSIDLIPYTKQVPLLKEENTKLKEQNSMFTECLLEMSESVYS